MPSRKEHLKSFEAVFFFLQQRRKAGEADPAAGIRLEYSLQILEKYFGKLLVPFENYKESEAGSCALAELKLASFPLSMTSSPFLFACQVN